MEYQQEGQGQVSPIEQQISMMEQVANNSAQTLHIRLNSDDIIIRIQLFLEGKEWDEDGQEYKQVREAMLGKKGVSYIISAVYPYTSKMITLGNLDEEEARGMAKRQEQNIADVLFENYEEFELKEAYYSTVVSLAGDIIYSSLTRSIKGAENKNMTSGTNTVEHIKEIPIQKKGLLGSVGSLLGGKN